MKEIWKLIELLNEYEDWMVSWVKEYVEEFGVFVLNTEQMIEEEIIISKSFWFIKRLVENDKIDRDKMNEKAEYKIYYSGTPREVKQTSIDGLLMLLSISDTPIDDLVSYLK